LYQNEKAMTIPDWIPATLIAALLIGVIWWKFSSDIRFAMKGRWTEGRIMNWMSATEAGKKYYYPLIEFCTEGGVSVTYRAEERSEGKPMYEPGTTVKVKYDPENPKRVKTVYPKA
jgi:hypothetical protein